MRVLLALALLAVAASSSLAAPWWLALALIPGLLASGAIAGRDPGPAMTQQTGYFIHGPKCTWYRDVCSCEELVGWIGEEVAA